MHSLPHRSATRFILSPDYTKIDIFTLHTNLLSLPQTHKYTNTHKAYKPPNSCFHTLEVTSSIQPPPDKPHYFLITLDTSNHSHSVIHKQEKPQDWACIKAPSDEKMQQTPYLTNLQPESTPVCAPKLTSLPSCNYAFTLTSSTHPPKIKLIVSYHFRCFQSLAHCPPQAGRNTGLSLH
jgi:hypothetical protein